MFSPISRIGARSGVLQAQRIQHQLPVRVIIRRLAAHDLDHPAGNHDRGVVVGQHPPSGVCCGSFFTSAMARQLSSPRPYGR